MKKLFLVLIVCFSAFFVNAQKGGDTAQKLTAVDSVLVEGKNYTAAQIAMYLRTNWKFLTVQQIDDFMLFLDNVHKELSKYYLSELEKKKKK